MIGDSLIYIAIFFLRNIVLKVLPLDFPFVPAADFQNYLTGLTTFLTPTLALLNLVFYLPFLLAVPLLIITAEGALALFKMGVFGANIARGSGA